MRDAFGHAQLGGVGPLVARLVKERLGYKYHWAVADYLQRAARHIASKTDLEQAYAVGAAAVELALDGTNGVMPAIVRISDRPYRWKIGTVELAKVANARSAAARLHHRRRLPHHARVPALSRPADPRRGFPAFRDGLPDYVRYATIRCRSSSPRGSKSDAARAIIARF